MGWFLVGCFGSCCVEWFVGVVVVVLWFGWVLFGMVGLVVVFCWCGGVGCVVCVLCFIGSGIRFLCRLLVCVVFDSVLVVEVVGVLVWGMVWLVLL